MVKEYYEGQHKMLEKVWNKMATNEIALDEFKLTKPNFEQLMKELLQEIKGDK